MLDFTKKLYFAKIAEYPERGRQMALPQADPADKQHIQDYQSCSLVVLKVLNILKTAGILFNRNGITGDFPTIRKTLII